MFRNVRLAFAGIGVAAVFAASAPCGRSQAPANRSDPTDAEIEALIDRLKDIDRQDTGYSASMSGSSFLPFGRREMSVAMLFQAPNQASGVMKSLVKLGPKAVPMLLKHLSDDRKTKMEVGPVPGAFSIEEDEEPEPKDKKPGADEAKKSPLDGGLEGFGFKRRYTVMVGDLCYVALGQIVNRPYAAVKYIPSGNVGITSVPRLKKLRAKLIAEWGRLTPEKHLASLVKDLEGSESFDPGTALRLGYWYPAELEPLAIKQLARPAAPTSGDTQRFLWDRVYPAKTAKERNDLVDAYVAKHGPIARDGVRLDLFYDLWFQERYEQGRNKDAPSVVYRARETLIEAFGYPGTVTSKDGPKRGVLTVADQARLVGTLLYDDGAKLDRAVADILAKTEDDSLGQECLKRLFGRGFDGAIEAYLKRIRPTLPKSELGWLRECEAKLGWTRIHAAVELGLDEMAERAIRSKAPLDAKGRDGRTALHLAAALGHADIVRRLLASGADADIRDAHDETALDAAVREDIPEIVRTLAAKSKAPLGILAAALLGKSDRLGELLTATPEAIKTTNEDGYAPLHLAVREGHADAVRLLLERGADVKATDQPRRPYSSSNGWTSLHIAAMSRQPKIAAILIDKGAEVDALDAYAKATPLHYAAWLGNSELVTLLLDRGADRGRKDAQDRTPLDLAKEKKHAAAIKLLETTK